MDPVGLGSPVPNPGRRGWAGAQGHPVHGWPKWIRLKKTIGQPDP